MKGEDQQEVKGCEGGGEEKKRWCNSEHGVEGLALVRCVLNLA